MGSVESRSFEAVTLAGLFRDPRGRAFVAEYFPQSVLNLFDAVVARPEWASAADLTEQALVVVGVLEEQHEIAQRYQEDVDSGRMGFGDGGDEERDAAMRRVARILEPMAATETPPTAAEPPMAGDGLLGGDDEEPYSMADPPPATAAEPPPTAEESPVPGDGLLGGDDVEAAPTPADPPPATVAEPPPPTADTDGDGDAVDTYLTAELDNDGAALEIAKTYQLAVSFGIPAVIPQVGMVPTRIRFPSGADAVDLTVEVLSSDFTVPPFPQQLRVRRDGSSLGRAVFEVTPLAKQATTPGEQLTWTLSVLVTIKGNFLQRLDLTYEVGGSADAEVTAYGRPLGAVDVLQERVATLQFTPKDWGYELFARQVTSKSLQLRVSPNDLDNRIAEVRAALLESVEKPAVALEMAISDADNTALLAKLAAAGFRLFQLLFEDNATPELLEVGDWLRTTLTSGVTTLQVVSDGFPVPWPLLYLAERWDPSTLTWDDFVGMRCVVEQVPLAQITTVPPSPAIESTPELSVRALFNDSIDAKMPSKPIAEQRRYWTGRGVSLTEGTSVDDLLTGALSPTASDKVLYLYCHAEASGKDTDKSRLILTGADSITLGRLRMEASRRDQLAAHPLVFINACESGTLTPDFYDGFVPYFLSKGARGVVGTECKTPGLFASEWAKAFFDELFAGKALGEVVLELRRRFLSDFNNPLGLLYGVHCDTDTVVAPALAAPVA